MRRLITFVLLVLLVLLVAPTVARAQSTSPPSRHAPAWIAVGVGAGFGIGVWTGLRAFDDSINSDRKVWTTAIVSAAGGGVLAYLLTRHKKQPRPTYSLRSPASGDSREARDAGK